MERTPIEKRQEAREKRSGVDRLVNPNTSARGVFVNYLIAASGPLMLSKLDECRIEGKDEKKSGVFEKICAGKNLQSSVSKSD